MKELGNSGSRIINYKTIWGLSSIQFKDIKKEIKEEIPFKVIRLNQNESFSFTDTDNDSHKIKNIVPREIGVDVFDGSIMFNQEDVEITDL